MTEARLYVCDHCGTQAEPSRYGGQPEGWVMVMGLRAAATHYCSPGHLIADIGPGVDRCPVQDCTQPDPCEAHARA